MAAVSEKLGRETEEAWFLKSNQRLYILNDPELFMPGD
jgi:hypothetical protein